MRCRLVAHGDAVRRVELRRGDRLWRKHARLGDVHGALGQAERLGLHLGEAADVVEMQVAEEDDVHIGGLDVQRVHVGQQRRGVDVLRVEPNVHQDRGVVGADR